MACTNRSWSRVVLATCLVLGGKSLPAQLNWLTVPEAESLVELVPEVAASARRGDCPVFSDSYWNDGILVQVRPECSGSNSGMLIGSFLVNRRTGRVTNGEAGPPIESTEIETHRIALIEAARLRALSPIEAGCLAATAFKAGGRSAAPVSPPDLNKENAISVRRLGQAILGEVQFEVEATSRHDHIRINATFTVDVTTARVRDNDLGVDAHSAGLGLLTGQLMTIHLPPLLSREDVTAIALRVPPFNKAINDSCLMASSYYGSSGEAAQVGLSNTCVAGNPSSGPVMLVNIHTGAVFDQRHQVVLSTTASNQTARQALDALQKRRAEAQREVDNECSSVAYYSVDRYTGQQHASSRSARR